MRSDSSIHGKNSLLLTFEVIFKTSISVVDSLCVEISSVGLGGEVSAVDCSWSDLEDDAVVEEVRRWV